MCDEAKSRLIVLSLEVGTILPLVYQKVVKESVQKGGVQQGQARRSKKMINCENRVPNR